MKTRILVGILFTLLERKRVSAGELAQKYGCSERSIFRYIDELTCAGIPIDVVRGANGGICISDAFKLPRGLLTREEGLRLSEAIKAMCEQLRDPALLSAAKKLEVQYCDEPLTLGNILVDSGSWGDRHNFSDKLSLLENAISERAELAIDYVNREGEYTRRRIQPHLLVLKQNVWYVFAWCMLRKEFRLFKLGRIRAAVRTGKTFERHFFLRDDIPLGFWPSEDSAVLARFEISPEALPFVQDWLGAENIVTEKGVHVADVVLPDDSSLVGKILSFGAGLKVISPESLKERVRKEALRLAEVYRN